MDLGYNDDPITRYDSSDSEDEAAYAPPTPETHKMVVRLSPTFERCSSTVVISLLPLPQGSNTSSAHAADTQGGTNKTSKSRGLASSETATNPRYTQMGVIYAPVAQPKNKLPLGDASCVQTNNALARILQEHDSGTMYVVASGATPPEVQHAWIRAVAGNLSLERIVLVDALEVDGMGASLANNRYRSPAVLASAIVVGLAAAILNYADTYSVPCRHVRIDGGVAPVLSAEDIDALFASDNVCHSLQQNEESLSVLAEAAGQRETSASLYV
ncbi:hypothetical protein IW140_000348 [Coemansia sp. RSA 1813]|nr:hypothetical protein EV178_000694 [Coemansia sp. RSA 1646]KAJ1773220.1 hypothetical protein LPJ74_000730 [Coemansia sp. RSA 1843]KAJ2092688.1 hypothetical protein IW138_000782 [Coemansia sp. RSA 986]KAJ2217815.1 hypothetical protein EV179_000301 [Coemansia sp. RSA 487]KAJ2572950.1 hypothetical protein IW140_000348 [Coemansia sp. RSA 1813]